MKVFITGASGFIGTALTRELLANGHTVLGLARSDASAEKIKALGADVHRGDTEDLDSIRAGARAADAVVHTAFDHSSTDRSGAAAKDHATIEALGGVLVGTHKPFITSSGVLGMAGRSAGLLTEDVPAVAEGLGVRRATSEILTLGFAQQGVRASVVRFAPNVHGGPDRPAASLVGIIAGAARKHGVAAYIGDGSARWPAADVVDVAVLLRLILENGPGGLVYHAVAEEGNSLFDIASAIGGHLSLPTTSIVLGEEATAQFGFLAPFMVADVPTSSAITRERTGWRPTNPGLLDELRVGNPNYY